MPSGGKGVGDLDAWLAPFLDVMGRKTGRAWAPFYLRGLLWDWDYPVLVDTADAFA